MNVNADRRLSRRALLKCGAMALFGAGAVPSFLSRAALATEVPARGPQKVLVTVFQRLGMDGLSAVAPFGDADLWRLRPQFMLPPPGSARSGAYLALDGQYGLHPSFAPLARLFANGELAIIHGVGSPHPTRSHPVAQLWWESGAPGDRRQRDGWLNRAISAIPGGNQHPLRAVALSASRPRAFYGDEPVVSVASLDALAPASVEHGTGSDASGLIEAMYRESAVPMLQKAGRDAFDVMRALRHTRSRARNLEAAGYPQRSAFAEALADIATLIRSDVGLQYAFADSRTGAGGDGNWDTHANQGALDGPFARVAEDFTASIAAFWRDLGDCRDDVVLVTLTEFGRNVAPNRDLGTEHGRATAMFVLGRNVRGGRVYGSLPERFVPDALEDGVDIPVTTDFRSVLTDVLQAQFALVDPSLVFPNFLGSDHRITLF